MEDKIQCPLIDGLIEVGNCVVYADVASGMLKGICIPNEFKEKKNWRAICKNCKYHTL